MMTLSRTALRVGVCLDSHGFLKDTLARHSSEIPPSHSSTECLSSFKNLGSFYRTSVSWCHSKGFTISVVGAAYIVGLEVASKAIADTNNVVIVRDKFSVTKWHVFTLL